MPKNGNICQIKPNSLDCKGKIGVGDCPGIEKCQCLSRHKEASAGRRKEAQKMMIPKKSRTGPSTKIKPAGHLKDTGRRDQAPRVPRF
ncbi:MAG: hypothetical protein QG614_636 [Patescibacteria group bacterium]|nr:hypothetical protein [Patescibacteria group bacterium]